MHKLIEYTCDELKSLEKKVGNGQQLSSAEVQYADMLAHLKKNLLKGEEMMDEMDEEGYSNRGYSNRGYSRVYNDGTNSYNARYSRARGRTNARRDSMGRYSRNGYSMENEPIMAELREMMNDTQDERIRQKIQNLIHEMESM